MAGKGYLYCATGTSFYNEAVFSAKSLKKHAPNCQIAICTNYDIVDSIFDIHIKIESSYSYADKINSILLTPFDYTIYLDSDTFINDSIDSLFGLLDYYDACMSPECGRPIYKNIPIEIIDIQEYNTGVIVYKKSINSLFKVWLEVYLTRRQIDFHDQLSLVIAIALSKCKIGLLPPEYNFRGIHPQVLSRVVKVVHSRYKNYHKIIQMVNRGMASETCKVRGWIPSKNCYIETNGNIFLFGIKKIYNSIFKKNVKRFNNK